MDISAGTLSSITDKVVPAMNEWRSRSLESVYVSRVPGLYALYKVREGSSVIPRAVYNILGVSLEGKKELLGMYLSEVKARSSGWLF